MAPTPLLDTIPARKIYDTPEGHALSRKILNEYLPFTPHDYQIEGICPVLDGRDVLATMATGMGKSGFFYMIMIVINAIVADPSLALGDRTFPTDPGMILACPTKVLQVDLAEKMVRFNLKASIINSDTYGEAQKQGRDLWVEARKGVTILLLSPEEMQSRGFRRLLDHPAFSSRVCVLAIDEVHLLHWWGRSFRRAFLMLGTVRELLLVRKGERLPVLGVSATLREGPVLDAVCSCLGLVSGQFHFMRRSNMRHDIQIICRELRSGICGINFPDLDWILDEGDNTLIFCKTIARGFRVAAYLWRKAGDHRMPNRQNRVRLYNALNWPEYNNETLGFLNNNTQASITIATDILSVGWDSCYTRNAVIIGHPDDIDEFVQKIGRIGRDSEAVPFPQAFLYYSQGAMAIAQKVVAAGAPPIPQFSSVEISNPMNKNNTRKADDETMDLGVARLLVAPCKPEELHKACNNPLNDIPCTSSCQTCSKSPPPVRHAQCNCSGCQPEPPKNPLVRRRAPARYPRAPRGEGISKNMRIYGTARLLELRSALFSEGIDQEHFFLPPEEFLPDEVIKSILDHFHLIRQVGDVPSVVGHIKLLEAQAHEQIFQFCVHLRQEFAKRRLDSEQDEEIQLDLPAQSTSNAEDTVISAEPDPGHGTAEILAASQGGLK